MSALNEEDHARLTRVLERVFEMHRDGDISTNTAVDHLATLIKQVAVANLVTKDRLHDVICRQGVSTDADI